MQNGTEKTYNAAEDRLANLRPLLFTTIFCILGVAFAYLCVKEGAFVWWFALVVPCGTALVCFFTGLHTVKRILFAALVSVTSFFLGFGLFYAQTSTYASGKDYAGEYPVVARVCDITQAQDKLCLTLDDVNIDGNEEKGKLIAYLPASFSENVRLSDKVLLRGKVEKRTSEFNVYRIAENVRFTMYAGECTVVGRSPNIFLLIKDHIREVVYTGMDDTSAAVTMAVLTGDTSGIDGDLLGNMRYGGIAHVFAVSGLHIGALFAFCLGLIEKTPLHRTRKRTRFVLVAATLLLYGGICGYTASVVRASVTCLVYYAATLIGFGSDGLERLSLSALVVLCISPVALFTVGFQLTFVASGGILTLTRPFSSLIDGGLEKVERLFGKTPPVADPNGDGHPLTIAQRIRRAIISFLGVTIAAQLSTAPILLINFGYISGWSLLLNGLFVPLISASFSLLLAFVAVSCVLPLAASGFVLYVPSVVWNAALLLFECADFSSFALTGITLAAPAIVAYYASLTFVTDKWNISRRIQLVLIATFALVFLVLTILGNV